jgi:translation initiation factor 4A
MEAINATNANIEANQDNGKDYDLKVISNWDEFDLNDNILRGIYSYGFEKPSQIQQIAILPILQKNDLIAQAPSGTGKTGAFTISALQRIDLSSNTTQVLIMAPTHELVKQIYSVITSIGNAMSNLKVKYLVGGTSVTDDASELRNNVPHVIVGSVGRVSDMIRRRNIHTKDIKLFVLDEADEMLSGGFLENIRQIFMTFDHNVQTAIFSATMPQEILDLTNRFMKNPVRITMEAEKLNLEGIQQFYIALNNDEDKYATLMDLFSKLTINQTIIYANSVNRVTDLYNAMVKDGCAVCCIHSSMSTAERHKSLQAFRSGEYRVLISSNVTARGIDVQQVSIVINFDIPRCVHNYLHRIGRSGRWGRKGVAINFITKEDVPSMKRIEKHYKSNITELPASFESLV